MVDLIYKRKHHNKAKLDERDVYAIKEMLHGGMVIKDIAENFDISTQNVWRIKTKKIWAHVPDYQPEGDMEEKIRPHGNAKLTPHDIYLINALIDEGLSASEIAEKFEIQPRQVYRIKAGECWKQMPRYEHI